MLYPIAKEYRLFSNIHGTFIKIDHMLDNKVFLLLLQSFIERIGTAKERAVGDCVHGSSSKNACLASTKP
jgi:hypothetical protein